MAALTFVSAAFATDTVWFYPPVGTWVSHGYPSGSGTCFNYNHSIVTQSYRSGGADPDTYVYYYDVYGGSSTPSGVTWRNLWLTDGHDSSRSKYFSAPLYWPFASDWTSSVNSWFNHYAYGDTRFGFPWAWYCQGMSAGVYGPY